MLQLTAVIQYPAAYPAARLSSNAAIIGRTLLRRCSCPAAYYRGAMGILLVYDVTDEASFNNIRNWMKNIETHASSSVNKVPVLVGWLAMTSGPF